MDTTGNRRATRVANTRVRIADTALDLFVERGFAATTIDQIAESAGVSRRSFFRYFPTKEAVLFGGYDLSQEWILEHLRGTPPGEPPLVTLVAVMRELVARPVKRTQLRKVREVVSRDPALRAAQRLDMVDRFSARLVESLLKSHPALSADELAPIVGMSLYWLECAIRQHIGDDSRSALERFDDIVALCSGACVDLPAAASRRS